MRTFGYILFGVSAHSDNATLQEVHKVCASQDYFVNFYLQVNKSPHHRITGSPSVPVAFKIQRAVQLVMSAMVFGAFGNVQFTEEGKKEYAIMHQLHNCLLGKCEGKPLLYGLG